MVAEWLLPIALIVAVLVFFGLGFIVGHFSVNNPLSAGYTKPKEPRLQDESTQPNIIMIIADDLVRSTTS